MEHTPGFEAIVKWRIAGMAQVELIGRIKRIAKVSRKLYVVVGLTRRRDYCVGVSTCVKCGLQVEWH